MSEDLQAKVIEIVATYRAASHLLADCQNARFSQATETQALQIGADTQRESYMTMLKRAKVLLEPFGPLRTALDAAPILNNGGNLVALRQTAGGLSVLIGVLEAFLDLYMQPADKEKIGFLPPQRIGATSRTEGDPPGPDKT